MWARFVEGAVKTAQDISNDLKTTVSGDRYRFVDEDINLDLTYITNRIVAMGFPAQGKESLYRNSAADLHVWVNRYHKDHWKIFNVSETNYKCPMWDECQVYYHGWRDHHPPPLEHLLEVIEEIDKWLHANPENIAMVHCLAGKARTGTVIICYMLYKNLFTSADEAIDYFNKKRGETPSFILPSQIRCVHNFFTLLKYSQTLNLEVGKLNTRPLTDPTVAVLKKMIITPIIKGSPSGDGCEPVVEIHDREDKGPPKYGTVLPTKRYLVDDPSNYMVIDLDKEVCGDVLIRFFHQAHVPGIRPIKFQLFRLHFNTSFQLGYGDSVATFLDFEANELDCKDNTDEKELTLGRRHSFPPGLRVRLLFEVKV